MSEQSKAPRTDLPRPRSAAVFDGPDRAAARAYMKGIGLTNEDLSKPTVGIANTWTDAMPWNYGLRTLPEFVKDEAELRQLWSSPDTRRKLLQGLEEKGFGADQLAEMRDSPSPQ